MPDASARVGYVVGIARDDVNMEVSNRLTGNWPGVEPDVVARRLVIGIDATLDVVDQSEQVGPFLGSGFPPGRDEPPRDDERVPRAHREAVPDREGGAVAGDALVGRDGEERGREARVGALSHRQAGSVQFDTRCPLLTSPTLDLPGCLREQEAPVSVDGTS